MTLHAVRFAAAIKTTSLLAVLHSMQYIGRCDAASIVADAEAREELTYISLFLGKLRAIGGGATILEALTL